MQSLQLSIPKPCHENWDKMTPTEQGRFCDACAKNVVDFTTMSDGEVLNFFLKSKDENVCGRTLPQQLDRVLEAPKPITPSKLWYWKYAAAGLLFFTKADSLQAQSVTPFTPQQINTINNTLQSKVGEIAVTTSKVISGKVTDKEGKEVPFASVKIKGTNRGTTADANGEFKITVDFENAILEISSYGYKANNLEVTKAENYKVKLERSNINRLNEVVVGWISTSNYYYYPKLQKHIATIKVKDAETKTTINDATLYVNEEDDLAFDTIKLNDGIYNIKNINEYDEYTIQASKEGYESKAIVISEKNFNKRKGVFEIELEKVKEVPQGINIRGDVRVVLGGVRSIINNNQPLYVLDGKIVSNEVFSKINSKEIQDISILKATQATAIYGSSGANGAIIITIKKQHLTKDSLPMSNYKLMKEVVVNSIIDTRRIGKVTTTGAVAVISGEMQSTLVCTTEGKNVKLDTLKQKILNLFSPIKIYPNPAQKGQPINISFSNKYNSYTIQVVNALGVVVLNQRRQNSFKEAGVFFKKVTEQIIVNSQWSSGYYLINIFNEQGKLIAKDGFLVL